MTGRSPGGAVRDLLREAGRWRLLAVLFGRPRAGWLAEVRALAAELADDGLARAAAAAAEATEGAYLAVLGPGGTVSPREVYYAGLSDPGRTLAGLETLYRAVGYRPSGEDPVDHVATQLDFAAFATLKLAFASARGEGEVVETVRAVRETFFEDHLGPFAARFAERLSGSGAAWLDRSSTRLAAMPAIAKRSAGPAARRAAPGLRVLHSDPFEAGAGCAACVEPEG